MPARIAALVLVAILLGACAAIPKSGCKEQVEYRLYFGGDTPSGPVSPAQWAAFVGDTLTPRFPEGLTVYNARGQWRDSNGKLLGEDTRVVELVREGGAADNASIAAAAKAYSDRFQQESVLVTHRPVRACQ